MTDAAAQQRLPLFPLGSTLCPGAQLHLRVFEPRYVRLVEDLRRADGPADFGVVAIRAGHEVGVGAVRELYDIGCVARLEGLEPTSPGGPVAYRLRARGIERFRLDGLDPSPETPYLTGIVSRVADLDGGTPQQLAEAAASVRAALAAYRELVRVPLEVGPELSAQQRADPLTALTPARLAYLVADAVVLEVVDRQGILSAATTLDRLHIGRAMVRREIALLRRLHVVPRAFQPGPSAPN
jgi:Lon protease-like protein